jgi:hypothetical protein
MKGDKAMPCNLAVTITKGVVAPDHLKKLLTPEAGWLTNLRHLKKR